MSQTHKPATANDTPLFRFLALLPPSYSPAETPTPSVYVHSKPHYQAPRRGTVEAEGRLATTDPSGRGALEFRVVTDVPLDNISTISDLILSRRLPSIDAEDSVSLTVVAQELDRLWVSHDGKLPGFAFSKSHRPLEIEYVQTLLLQKDTLQKTTENKCHNCRLKEEHFRLEEGRLALVEDIEELRFATTHQSLDLFNEMKLKYQVLKSRGFLDMDTGTITLKGRVACEITSSDEITLADAIFENVFQDKTPEEAASLLSAFVFPEKSEDEPPGPTAGILDGREKIEKLHSEIEKLMYALQVRVDSKEWWKLCNFNLSLVVYEWARGTSFADIMHLTSLQEGTIVRGILRLDELVRKMKTAAKLIGDSSLENLMERVSGMIRRDIVFVISLYLQ